MDILEYIGNILFDEKLLKYKGNIIIYGIGKYGMKIREFLLLNGKESEVCGFCDMKGMEGKKIEGLPVYEPAECFCKYPDALYLIGGKYCKEMYALLKYNGSFNIHMLLL